MSHTIRHIRTTQSGTYVHTITNIPNTIAGTYVPHNQVHTYNQLLTSHTITYIPHTIRYIPNTIRYIHPTHLRSTYIPHTIKYFRLTQLHINPLHSGTGCDNIFAIDNFYCMSVLLGCFFSIIFFFVINPKECDERDAFYLEKMSYN